MKNYWMSLINQIASTMENTLKIGVYALKMSNDRTPELDSETADE